MDKRLIKDLVQMVVGFAGIFAWALASRMLIAARPIAPDEAAGFVLPYGDHGRTVYFSTLDYVEMYLVLPGAFLLIMLLVGRFTKP